jgi:hypothetical protein
MKGFFLGVAVACLVVFVVAGLFAGELIPSFGESRHAFRSRRGNGPSIWSIVQNVSALLGIVSFLIQVVQWRRRRRS